MTNIKFIVGLFLLMISSLVLASTKTSSSKSIKIPKSKDQTMQQAILAGGCFWGMEELLRKLPGVTHVQVGYTGGTIKNATYELVKTGATQHAEAVKLEFDPTKTSYENIILYFFKIHDPTTENRQGGDVGSQYRSAIFYMNNEQKEIAQSVILRVDKSKAWGKPVVTKLEQVTHFWPAEDYHQDYLQKNPNGYTCHYIRSVKF